METSNHATPSESIQDSRESMSISKLSSLSVSTTEAAEYVLEVQRKMQETEKQKLKKPNGDSTNTLTQEENIDPDLEKEEKVSGWEGDDYGRVEHVQDELARRQNQLAKQLAERERKIQEQAALLKKTRLELQQLEIPLKENIFNSRTVLEEINREETQLVARVNALRADLRDCEKQLAKVRQSKKENGEKLIRIMADYERQRKERLDKIAHLIDSDHPSSATSASSSEASSMSAKKEQESKPLFGGF